MVTVPPAESIVKLPELVSISLSAVTPNCTFPAVEPVEEMSPVNVPVVPDTAPEKVPATPTTVLVNVPVVPETAPVNAPVVPVTAPAANVPPHVRTPLPSVINAWFAAPSSLGKVNV